MDLHCPLPPSKRSRHLRGSLGRFGVPPPLSSSRRSLCAPSLAATASTTPATASSALTTPPTIHHLSDHCRQRYCCGNLPSQPRVRRNHSACLLFPARSFASSLDTPRYQASTLVITLFIRLYRHFK
ncbi:hypothetical protein L227DRAFT_15366 [Lentinus tigrinus ALCF2SS1-6]|uniref:Uncharacterized protein n=1 Tax=Lentinus tigrinus ALCF2SS1-6 TaxID=1328759 RepID=A0A5C2SU36_9APHY|nr:hypothetical protein L227DRAFT_15366 [Lentinus tigrinus ALCF2SS1-6]